MLNHYLLADEDYILARYVSILKKKKIQTVEDLLFDFPIKYEDYTIHSIHDAILDVPTILEGTIVSKVTVNYLKSKLSTVVFQLDVEGRKIRCTIFNRIYLKGKLNYGSVIRVQGKFYQNMNNFTVNNLMICDELDRNIIPIYHNKDIGEAKYLEIVSMVYRRYKDKIEETLPQKFLDKYHFSSLKETIYTLHLSENLDEIHQAIQRVKYEELLKYQLSMKYLHYMRENDHNCPIINYDSQVLEKLKTSLPYELTDDQKKVISEILKDLKAPYAMNRLLQGEVGSGKTIVAIISIMAVVSGGYQAVLMCPTEILSKQHYQTISQILKDDKEVKIGLLTGSTPLKQRKEMIEKIDKYAKLVNMQDFLDENPENLSGGQKQRVAIAGALAMDTDLIIFDESTSMLDPKGTKEIHQMIETLRKTYHKTIISITHNLEEALIADRVIVLNEGKIVLDGTPKEVLKEQTILEASGLKLIDGISLLNRIQDSKLHINKKEEIIKELWELTFKM